MNLLIHYSSTCRAWLTLFKQVQWAGTLLGCVAIVLVPMPVIFYLKGAQIRAKSNFAPTFPVASQAANATRDESDLEKNE